MEQQKKLLADRNVFIGLSGFHQSVKHHCPEVDALCLDVDAGISPHAGIVITTIFSSSPAWLHR